MTTKTKKNAMTSKAAVNTQEPTDTKVQFIMNDYWASHCDMEFTQKVILEAFDRMSNGYCLLPISAVGFNNFVNVLVSEDIAKAKQAGWDINPDTTHIVVLQMFDNQQERFVEFQKLSKTYSAQDVNSWNADFMKKSA